MIFVSNFVVYLFVWTIVYIFMYHLFIGHNNDWFLSTRVVQLEVPGIGKKKIQNGGDLICKSKYLIYTLEPTPRLTKTQVLVFDAQWFVGYIKYVLISFLVIWYLYWINQRFIYLLGLFCFITAGVLNMFNVIFSGKS